MTRTIVITGASDGIGAAAARELVKQGEKVVIVGRSPEKTKKIAKELGTDFFIADFAKLSEIRRLAEGLKAKYKTIDVLANNAGGMVDAKAVTEDGFGMAFQVNYLAPFLLTNLLLDTLVASKATVISTSSMAHTGAGKLRFDELSHGLKHSGWGAYAGVKLLNILFTRELHKRYASKDISAVAFHPGVVRTSFGSEGSSLVKWFYGSRLAKKVFLTPAQGADTLVWLATHTAKSGEYYIKRKVAKATATAMDAKLATSVWNKTVKLLGLES
jgi:NAD(P)-dependent dehydrogenase (short-subunit alcohol dehydrogenase family)